MVADLTGLALLGQQTIGPAFRDSSTTLPLDLKLPSAVRDMDEWPDILPHRATFPVVRRPDGQEMFHLKPALERGMLTQSAHIDDRMAHPTMSKDHREGDTRSGCSCGSADRKERSLAFGRFQDRLHGDSCRQARSGSYTRGGRPNRCISFRWLIAGAVHLRAPDIGVGQARR